MSDRLEDRVEQLERELDVLRSIQEIDARTSDYYQAFDYRDIKLLASVLHDDARIEMRDIGADPETGRGVTIYEGKDAWLHDYAEKVAWVRNIHTSHGVVNRSTEVDGDTARMRANTNVWLQRLNQGWNHAAGTNYDTWERVDGRWLLKERIQPMHWRFGSPRTPSY